jgi:hypothetical protein
MLKDYIKAFSAIEPARVRALWMAIVGLLAAAGIIVSSSYSDAVSAFIVALFTILPVLQGELTRAKVSPVATGDEDEEIITESAE